MTIDKLKVWYRLSEQKSIGLVQAHKIINDLGDPINYIGMKSDLWEKIGYISNDIKENLQNDIDPPNWKKIIEFAGKYSQLKFITFFEDEYPNYLKEIYAPPLFLTAIGDISLLKHPNIISIVGTRKPTHYGKQTTEKIVASLVSNNYLVCSGLALGIDAVSHLTTLDYGGKTIAVTASGLDNIYPPQNRNLANKIVATGLIISENMPYTKIEKYHFPQRNRIIAGLSKAVCVIEGKIQSGAMITAKYALDQNKEVYALPGDITKSEAEGPNTLILKGAKILLTPNDIVADLNIVYNKITTKPIFTLSDEEMIIYKLIKKYSPETHVDQIILETGLSLGEISGLLFMMELKNAIKTTDNGKYTIT